MASYADILRRRGPAGLESPMDSLEAGSMIPEIDFSKDTLSEQSATPAMVGGEEIKTVPSSFDKKAGAVEGAKTLAGGGKASDAAAAGLIATGNPYAIGAGLALSTYSGIQKKKQEQKQNKYVAELQKAEARRDALNRLSQIGQSLKA
jgi:hypothetical protein